MNHYEFRATALENELNQMSRMHEVESRNRSEKYLSEMRDHQELEMFRHQRLEMRISGLNDELNDERNRLTSLQNRHQKMIELKQRQAMVTDIDEYGTLNKLENELAVKERDISAAKSESIALRAENQNLESRVNRLSMGLYEVNQVQDRSASEVNSELRELANRRANLESDIVELRSKKSELSQIIEQQRADYRNPYGNDMVPEMAELRLQLRRKDREMTTLSEQRLQLLNDLKMKESEVYSLYDDKKHLRQELSSVNAKLLLGESMVVSSESYASSHSESSEMSKLKTELNEMHSKMIKERDECSLFRLREGDLSNKYEEEENEVIYQKDRADRYRDRSDEYKIWYEQEEQVAEEEAEARASSSQFSSAKVTRKEADKIEIRDWPKLNDINVWKSSVVQVVILQRPDVLVFQQANDVDPTSGITSCPTSTNSFVGRVVCSDLMPQCCVDLLRGFVVSLTQPFDIVSFLAEVFRTRHYGHIHEHSANIRHDAHLSHCGTRIDALKEFMVGHDGRVCWWIGTVHVCLAHVVTRSMLNHSVELVLVSW